MLFKLGKNKVLKDKSGKSLGTNFSRWILFTETTYVSYRDLENCKIDTNTVSFILFIILPPKKSAPKNNKKPCTKLNTLVNSSRCKS